jgi:hypothetical protein
MNEDFAPAGPDSDPMSPGAANGVEPVLEELRTIIQLAGDRYHGEQRMDTANEVVDTVRFAQATMSWRERITPAAILEIHLAHDQLPVIKGHVLWATDWFLCLADERHEYLVNTRNVVMVSGLTSYAVPNAPSAVADQLDSIWLGGLLEDQLLATWYLASNQVLAGRCTRLGIDAVDVISGTASFTALLQQVVAVRIPSHA